MESSNRRFYGWTIVASLWVIYFLNVGFPMYGGQTVNTFMSDEMQFNRTILGLGFSLFNLFQGLPGPLIGYTIQKKGARFCMAIGSALILIAAVLMGYFVKNQWVFLFTFGIIAGVGVGFGTVVPVQTTVTQWFTKRRARAMAITLTAFVVIIAIVVGARRGYLDYLVIRIARHAKKERRCKIIAFYRDTKSAIALLAASPKAMLLVFAESGLNLLCIYAIVPCLLLGLGVTDADWYSVMGRMIFLNMLLYFTPTPGGSGIAEGGFVLLFSDTVPAGTVGIVAVCWRLIAEYIPFLIGLYYTLTVFGRDFLNRQLR